MKAKEWAAKINGTQSEEEMNEVLGALMKDLFGSMTMLKEQRHVQTLPGMRGILLEVFQKYNAIVKRCPTLKKDGFEEYVRKQIPNVDKILNSNRKPPKAQSSKERKS